jgi:hypothetical protein
MNILKLQCSNLTTTMVHSTEVPDYRLLLTGWYHTKCPMQLQQFTDLLCSTSELKSFTIHLPEFSAPVAAHT